MRIGNTVTVWGYVTIQTLNGAASGAFTIDGLPFVIRNVFGLDSCADVAFSFGTPALTKGRGEAGGYAIKFDGITKTGFSSGADIRFQMTYETTELGPWGW